MSELKITPGYFTTMKSRINAEMNRRKYNGSLVSYAGAVYQYTVGNSILLEHVDKNLEPLRAINPDGQPALGPKFMKLQDKEVMDSKLLIYESNPETSSTNDCANLCSGLCVSACDIGCTGCTSCTGSCIGTCQSQCANDCTGGCTRQCADGCSGSCRGGCSDACTSCIGGCTSCSGGCSGGCTSCTAACRSSSF